MDTPVVDLAARRAERDEQRIRAATNHPALRWTAGAAFWTAHRKEGPGAACGANGALTLAPPGTPRCVECFPLADRTDP